MSPTPSAPPDEDESDEETKKASERTSTSNNTDSSISPSAYKVDTEPVVQLSKNVIPTCVDQPTDNITSTPVIPSLPSYGNDIDEAIAIMGPRSRFQIILVISMTLISLTTTYNFILPYFTAGDPPWRCVGANSSEFCRQHINDTIDSNSDMFKERCKLRREEWTYVTARNFSYVTEFDLVCEDAAIGAFAMSSFYLGGVIGPVVVGIIADRFGRKPILLITLFVIICSSVLCTSVHTIWQLTCINIILGASTMGCSLLTMIYLSEYATPNSRALLYTILLVCTAVSSLVMDAVAYFERNWRELQLYLAFSTIFASVLPMILPESPRWLLAVGRATEAQGVFDKICRFNGRRTDEIILRRKRRSPTERKYTYLDICRNKKVLLLTLLLGVLRATIASVEYSITLESYHLGGDIYQAFAFTTLATVPSGMLCSYICNRFGRKRCILGGLFISGVFVGVVAMIPRSVPHLYVISIVIISSARFVNMIAFIGINIWIFELYPTVLRSQGMAVCGVFEKVGIFSAPFITKVLQRVHYIIPFVLICCMSLVMAGVGGLLPETSNRPTRERYSDFFKIRQLRLKEKEVNNTHAQNVDDE